MGQHPLTIEQMQEAVDAVAKYGSQNEAARQLNLSRPTFLNRYRQGVKRGLNKALVHAAPEGHTVRRVSSLYDNTGDLKLQWIQSNPDEPSIDEVAEIIREAMADIPAAVEVPKPSYSNADLVTVYAISDAHIGMRAWSKEVGESYDVDIATTRLRDWVARLVASSPPSAVGVILDVGDTTHIDDGTNQTPASKHNLDVDGRYYRTLDMTIAAMAAAIDSALVKHDLVHFVIIPGNHNPNSYMALSFAMAERYRHNPRVVVRKDPREFWAYRFGDCLLAAHHGDKAKPERLVMFLADEYAGDWGATKHRFLWTGHLHHHKSADIGGVKWEQLRAMTARDAYAYSHAFTARSQIQAITLHRQAGEVQRQSVSQYSV